MVLYRRKPVEFLENEDIPGNDTQVWHIKESGEYFTQYEDYLDRMDFFKQKKFLCQVSGHSNQTFFEAYYEELENSQQADADFPDALKEPVLRAANFKTTARMDRLVDEIYEVFRNDYYHGEHVYVIADQEKLEGVVREKAFFQEVRHPDGRVERAHTRYFVSLDHREEYEALVDDEHIGRDRHTFTKVVLKNFLKRAVARESWIGAPWIVKPAFAKRFRIDTNVPQHLTKGYVQDSDQWRNQISPGAAPPDSAKSSKSHKSKKEQQLKAKSAKGKDADPDGSTHSAVGDGAQVKPQAKKTSGSGPAHREIAPKPAKEIIPEPPPVKYPLDEDLELPPDSHAAPRPSLQFISSDDPIEELGVLRQVTRENIQFKMESAGALLATWETLNVFCQELTLDSFTFDDYLEALINCPREIDEALLLIPEIHCSVLKKLVNSEKDGGDIKIDLPDEPTESDKEQVSDDEAEMDAEPAAANPPAKTLPIRSSGFTAVNQSAAAAEPKKAKQATKHGCDEFLENYDWLDNLRRRNFAHGGWECIIVGLFYRLAFARRQKKRRTAILRLLHKLMPAYAEMGPLHVQARYYDLDVNDKVSIISILCSICVETKSIRNSMEQDAEAMTELRKEKVEAQRNRKALMAQLKDAKRARRDLDPDEDLINDHPSAAGADSRASSSELSNVDGSEGHGDSATLSDGEGHSSMTHRQGDRAIAKKRKRAEMEEQAKKKAKSEAEAQLAKVNKAKAKLDKEIEKLEKEFIAAEDKIAETDEDLRQADVYRAKVLGKDRFWNRYYWFERNGMPFGGMPDSSTAYAQYANGRIWVQGPDPIERKGYIDVEKRIADIYSSHYNLTPVERKRKEEGKTSLWNAHDWGFYDSPEELDKLLKWLDDKGRRELNLSKELKMRRDVIIEHMENREAYLHPEKAAERRKKKQAALDAEAADGVKRLRGLDISDPIGLSDDDVSSSDEDKVVPRTPNVSSRTRQKLEQNLGDEELHAGQKGWKTWNNSLANYELGHLHSQEPQKRVSRGKAVAKNVVQEARQTRGSRSTNVPLNRQGKPLTRQG